MRLMDFLSGQWVLKADGVFSERIVNIAKEEGIFVQNISKGKDGSLFFSVSYKGAMRIFSLSLPSDITLSVHSRHGLPAILQSRPKRLLLFISPFLIMLFLFLSTQVIWNVNIIDADPETEEFLLKELKKHGVRRGALKFTIDPGDVKNRMLIENEHLQWIWVDIRGGTALVKFSFRTMPPEIFTENDFYNVYSAHDAVVTKIIATNGIPKVNVGDTVFKGQLLIEGRMPLSFEEAVPIHASGTVYGEIWEEKTVTIPKKTQLRTPTGKKTEQLTINFLNFNIKLFINSSILYPEYDIIEDNRSFRPLKLNFNKKVFHEVDVSYYDTDLESMKNKYQSEFLKELDQNGVLVKHSETSTLDNNDSIMFTMRALCEVPISQERRMNFGENNSITDS